MAYAAPRGPGLVAGAQVLRDTSNEPAANRASATKSSPRVTVAKALRCYALSALYLFLIFLPYLHVMTDPFNRTILSFSFGMVLQVFAVIAILAVPLAAGYGLLQLTARKLPAPIARWLLRGGFAPFGAFGITVSVYLVWLHVPWSDFAAASVFYHQKFKWGWLVCVGLLVCSQRAYEFLQRWGGRGLTALTPLPIVLGLHLAQFPPLGAAPVPAPEALRGVNAGHTGATKSGPVYFFVFDEWDRIETFRDGYETYLPNLAAIQKTATTFEGAVSVHDMTLHSVPSIVFQDEAEVRVDAAGITHFRRGDTWVPAVEATSILTTLGQQKTHRVVLGRTLAFDYFLGDEATWVYQLPWDSGHYLSFSEACRAHLYRAYTYSHFPFHKAFGLTTYPQEFQVWANQQIHDNTLRAIAGGGSDIMGIFHYLVPHDPFVYDGEKVRPGYEDVGRERGYQDNLRFLDRWLGEIVAQIRAAGQWDRCTLVFTADHGTFRGEDRRQREIPLIVKLPGQQKARKVAGEFPVTRVVDWIHAETAAAGERPQ
ncbi:MAG: sulfatase-like hydrolase/transferase [Planctomycetota bacterium]